ncbi:MAG: molybdate ABC transporter substrate-binding protein [Pseudomonadota bacterium]
MTSCIRTCLALCLLVVNLSSADALAEEATIAVASNFKPAMAEIERSFEEQTGHELSVSFGSTGKIFSQIQFGAPFDVFLSADTQHTDRAIEDGLAIEETAFVYAIGSLVLWSPSETDISLPTLSSPSIRKLAMANPASAPYGVAAQETLAYFGMADTITLKRVLGESIGQAFAFVHTGNADAGLVALSQVLQLPDDQNGFYDAVPQEAYRPIEQSAVLLNRGDGNQAAEAFLEYLDSDSAQAIIRQYGYSTP